MGAESRLGDGEDSDELIGAVHPRGGKREGVLHTSARSRQADRAEETAPAQRSR
jgi:hypothetical protein